MNRNEKVARRDDTRMHTVEFAALTSIESPSAPPELERAHPAALPWTRGVWWVALGGALGALARSLITLLLPTTATLTLVDLPWGTYLANVGGCLILGVVMGVLEARPGARMLGRPQVRLALATGFCGAFTTMSTFTLELASMLGARFPLEAFQYAVISIVSVLGAFVGGFVLGRWFTLRRQRESGAPSERTGIFAEDYDDVPSLDVSVGEVAPTPPLGGRGLLGQRGRGRRRS
ncbi:MAG: CrcB family protein [Dermabacter sp.]|nr:CrcB family protein [Dermabacter sp.]